MWANAISYSHVADSNGIATGLPSGFEAVVEIKLAPERRRLTLRGRLISMP